jgi:hypothetical protein
MESKLIDYFADKNMLDFFSIVQTLIFGVFFCLIYILGTKAFNTIDERIFKKRVHSHSLTPWIKMAIPILIVIVFLVMVYANDILMNITLITLFATLLFYFLFKVIVALAHFVPLMMFMNLKEGAVLEIQGQIGQVKKIGLFYIELIEGGKSHIIPTGKLISSDFYLSQNLKSHQVSLNLDLAKEISKDNISKILRILEAKSYVDKSAQVEARVDAKRIFISIKVNRLSLTSYAKKDISQLVQQFV